MINEERFGLSPRTIQGICEVFSRHENICKAILYGSRAKGHYREGSDIDLTLIGDITYAQLAKILDEIDDLMLPYMVDLSVYDQLTHEDLKSHIDRVGVVFYSKCGLS